MPDFEVVSIGAMAANPDWGERVPVRTGHATTTLVRTGERVILIDPGLPEAALKARLGERANLDPADVTHVFLTSFHPDARRGIGLFDEATWWISEQEREAVGVPLAQTLGKASAEGNAEAIKVLEHEVALLRRCEAAPDELDESVSLFPLHGVSPGMTGVLIAGSRFTTLICGDAVPTAYALEHGVVHRGAVSVDEAQESFREAVEIADLIVPGRDNVTVNPTRRPF
ncbi:MAG: MBL fold metallo-hydrolase [Planctomycetota bacterium]